MVGVSSGSIKVARAPTAVPPFPVVSPRFPLLIVLSRRFSGVPPWIHVDFRLFAASIAQSRSNPGRMAPATCTATRVRCTSCDIQMCSNHDRTKSSVVREPGHPPLDQFSDSLSLRQQFPSTGPHMWFDSVLKSRQSVLRTLILVPLVFVFLFGSAKIGQTAITISAFVPASQAARDPQKLLKTGLQLQPDNSGVVHTLVRTVRAIPQKRPPSSRKCTTLLGMSWACRTCCGRAAGRNLYLGSEIVAGPDGPGLGTRERALQAEPSSIYDAVEGNCMM